MEYWSGFFGWLNEIFQKLDSSISLLKVQNPQKSQTLLLLNSRAGIRYNEIKEYSEW
jgi:hypothetical protein